MFPTEAEKTRADRINQDYDLFLGKFSNVLQYFRNSEEKKRSEEVIQNVAGLITRVFSDLMFLKNPIITVSDPKQQEAINDIIFDNNLFMQLYESAIAQSYAGRSYFKMYMKDGKPMIEEQNPATVFPQYSHWSTKIEPNSVIISWETNIGGQNYRYIEQHTVGHIDYRLTMIDSSGKTEKEAHISQFNPSLPENGEDTGLDYIPIYWCDNQKSGRETYGLSDYGDLRSLFTELTRVQSQIATQLRKHGDAKMAVPQGVLDENGNVINENLEMIEVSSADESGGLVIPQYIVNGNSEIEKCFAQQDKIMEAIARTAEVAQVLIDLNVSGGAERVGALKLRMLRTLAKVERKLKSYDWMIKNLIIDAVKWENPKMVIDHNDISIKFRNGLPEDLVEKAQVESMRLAAGNQTLRDSVKNLDNIDGELLDEKMETIKKEKEEMLASVGSGVPSIAF